MLPCSNRHLPWWKPGVSWLKRWCRFYFYNSWAKTFIMLAEVALFLFSVSNPLFCQGPTLQKDRQSVVTLKIDNSGLERFGVIHFWPFATFIWASTHTLGTTGLDQLTNCGVKLRRPLFLNDNAVPWWWSTVASFSQILNHFHTLCGLSGSDMCKFA